MSKFRKDTENHINDVKEIISRLTAMLSAKAENHDKSKLEGDEFDLFSEVLDNATPAKYGTPEYAEMTNSLKPALDSHYAKNPHHPQYHENGVDGMTLLDVLEMLADWVAATKRHPDDNILDSIKINKNKYNISDQLENILINTVKQYKLDK